MAYLESVDNALRLLLLLSDGRQVTVTGVAKELGVAPSTAHRLLSTLMYRQFAAQGADRAYSAGPAMLRMGRNQDSRTALLEAAGPHLAELTKAVDESCYVGVLVNRHMHYLAGELADHAPRNGTRSGQVLPAHESAGGKALLAGMRSTDFDMLYPPDGVAELGLDAPGLGRLREELDVTRRRGYAMARSGADRNTFAFGVPVPGADGRATGALVLTIPSVRYAAARLPQLVSHLRIGADRISAGLKQGRAEFDTRPRRGNARD